MIVPFKFKNKYEEEKSKGKGIEQALNIAIKRSGLAIFLALIISILCFSSMSFCGVPGLDILVLSIGLIIAYILSLTLLSALI